MYYTNVDDLQNRVASRAEILVLAGNVFPDWLLIKWVGNFDDEFSMSINFWKGILIIWFHTRTTEGSLHLYNIGFSKISMPETHFPNQEDETNFKTRLRRGSRCVFLGQRSVVVRVTSSGVCRTMFQERGNNNRQGVPGVPLRFNPWRWEIFPCKTTPKKIRFMSGLPWRSA